MNLACTASFPIVNSKTNAKESTTRKSAKKIHPAKSKRPAQKDIQEIVKEFNKKEGADLEMSVVTSMIVCVKHQRIMN